MVKYLAVQNQDIPILALVDHDPHGLEIYSVYKWGSQAQSFDQANLAVFRMELAGLRYRDRTEFAIPAVMYNPLTQWDRGKALSILRISQVRLREYDMNQFSGDSQHVRQDIATSLRHYM
ncbi:endodeoxyribonuclease [Apophysomyces ossiformis]|uniref:Endodeoxyribonuclease n=1 Tax=Apophysomyces ossiformis TaxID=679940 RepID=A0A8H7BFZ4_9FUNG|nr:endodeoxyribonuclease [Apophysomyces ossiformis]